MINVQNTFTLLQHFVDCDVLSNNELQQSEIVVKSLYHS